MQKKRPSKRVTFRANAHDQRTLKELLSEYVEKTSSQVIRDAIKEMLCRTKKRSTRCC